MRWLVVLVIACSKKDPPPPPPPPAPPVEEMGLAGRLADKAKSLGNDAVDKAKSVATKAGELSSGALDRGAALKRDLHGKLAVATDFDFAVDEIHESEADHAARLAGMKQIKVGSYTVGLAQDAKHPLGDVYKWQFRVTWRIPATERVIVVSVFSNETLAELENAATLLVIVQAAEHLVR